MVKNSILHVNVSPSHISSFLHTSRWLQLLTSPGRGGQGQVLSRLEFKASGVGVSGCGGCLELSLLGLRGWANLTLFLGGTYVYSSEIPRWRESTNASYLHFILRIQHFYLLFDHFTLVCSLRWQDFIYLKCLLIYF